MFEPLIIIGSMFVVVIVVGVIRWMVHWLDDDNFVRELAREKEKRREMGKSGGRSIPATGRRV